MALDPIALLDIRKLQGHRNRFAKRIRRVFNLRGFGFRLVDKAQDFIIIQADTRNLFITHLLFRLDIFKQSA